MIDLKYYYALVLLDDENCFGFSMRATSMKQTYIGVFDNFLRMGYDWWFIKNKVFVMDIHRIAKYREN